MKLGYNEQLGTGHFCSLTSEFVITEFHCTMNQIKFLCFKICEKQNGIKQMAFDIFPTQFLWFVTFF